MRNERYSRYRGPGRTSQIRFLNSARIPPPQKASAADRQTATDRASEAVTDEQEGANELARREGKDNL